MAVYEIRDGHSQTTPSSSCTEEVPFGFNRLLLEVDSSKSIFLSKRQEHEELCVETRHMSIWYPKGDHH